jgi:hypothetical protein
MDAVRDTVAENFSGKAHAVAKPEHQLSLEDTPDQSGKVAVVTGGSEGIGYGASFTLLQHNLTKLFVISVSKGTMDGAIADVRKKLGEPNADEITWLQCDIVQLESGGGDVEEDPSAYGSDRYPDPQRRPGAS